MTARGKHRETKISDTLFLLHRHRELRNTPPQHPLWGGEYWAADTPSHRPPPREGVGHPLWGGSKKKLTKAWKKACKDLQKLTNAWKSLKKLEKAYKRLTKLEKSYPKARKNLQNLAKAWKQLAKCLQKACKNQQSLHKLAKAYKSLQKLEKACKSL